MKRALLMLALLAQAAPAATPSAVRYTIRCTAANETLYEATIDGPRALDFDVALRDERFELKATFVNEVVAPDRIDVRVQLQSRRRHGTSRAGLPLWEESSQRQRLAVGFDQQIELLPFGGEGRRGLLKFEIVPNALNAETPIAIKIAKSASAIQVRAYSAPHWYTVGAALERNGAVVAKGSARAFRGEPAKLRLGDAAELNVRADLPPYRDPYEATLVTFDGAGAQSWEGVTAGAPMRYPLPDGSVLVLTAAPERELWPGFDPGAIPLAVFDGQRTTLTNHPSPPPEFRKNVYEGRHPSVTANSSVKLGGVETATAMTTDPAVAVHEQFHVFQRAKHPSWTANEADLFVYPFDDASLLAQQRAELEALRRALESRGGERQCWARAAMAIRRERFAKMPASAVAYERGTELNEGLAAYVQHRFAGVFEVRATDDVRARAYVTGEAIARLLDDVKPSWKETFDRGSLDELLREHLGAGDCVMTLDLERAKSDVAAMKQRLAAERAAFLDADGWRIIIEGPILFPSNFDPLNVKLVAPGEVLHTRYVKLGNERGSVEVLGRAALTEAAGEHPLFNGVRRVTIAGLAAEPVVTGDTITAEGVKIQMRGVRATRERGTIRVH